MQSMVDKQFFMVSLLGLLFVLIMSSMASTADRSSLKPASIYVSPAGNDTWSGKFSVSNTAKTDGPVATLERARDLIRELKRTKGLPQGGLVIEVKGGIYEITRSFDLTAEDSGTAAAPITYRGTDGQPVRLVGGRVLKGFKPVTDPAILARLVPEARGKVLQTDLKAHGITQYPPMKSSDTWAVSDPGIELFFADEPMTLSRWPNEGYTHIVDVKGPTPVDVRGTKGTMEGIFTYEGDRPSRWSEEPDLMANGYWMWDWADQRFRVKNIDLSTHTITLENPPMHEFGFRKGQWFYIYNALSELDKPGEWYLDRKNGILYFWPPQSLNKGKVMVSILRDMMTMQEVSYANIVGLTFECSQASGINISGGQNCRIAKCTLRNLGSAAINITNGLKHEVYGCDMYNLGNGGVNVYAGDRNTLTPGGINVENCHIYKFERWNPIYKPAISLNGVGNRAAHNLLNDAPHMAIGLSGNDNIIEYNEIHSVVYESNDAGALYGGRDWTMRGNQIRFNYFHDIYGFEGRGCVGVYLDDQFSSANIYGNVHYRVPMASMIGGGRDCTIENNIYVDCSPAIHIDARGLNWAFEAISTLTDRLNAVPYKSEPWKSRYPELVNILQEDPMAPKNLLVARNICVGGRWDDVEGQARPGVTFKDNLLNQDPLFVDAKNLNFNLRPESPAYKLGFKKIPFDKIGLYNDPMRASWPVKTKVRPAPINTSNPTRIVKPFTVARTNKAPKIDGVVSPDEWTKTVMTLAEDPNRAKIQGKPAVAYMVHDGKTLYVAITVPISNKAALKPGSKWGQDDGAEICFRPAANDVPAFVVRGFASGIVRSYSEAGVTPEAAEALGKVVRFASKLNDDNWTGEWAIPLSGAGIHYKARLKLAFNIGVLRNETSEWIVWSGAQGPNWKVENAGVIVLK